MEKIKISFWDFHQMYVDYMVWHVFCKHAYPSLQSTPIKSYDDWCKPDMYFIDGINKKELPINYKRRQYLSSEMEVETFDEWFKTI